MVQLVRSADVANCDATDAGHNVAFARSLACNVVLQYPVLFGAQSLATSRTCKHALVSQPPWNRGMSAGEVDVCHMQQHIVIPLTVQ